MKDEDKDLEQTIDLDSEEVSNTDQKQDVSTAGVGDDTEEDIVSEEELENPKTALKKLRAELKLVKQEKMELLTGWQKDKAEFLNARKRDQETQADVIRFANQNLIIDMLPTLDGYEQAKAQSTWSAVDEAWRQGIESLMTKIYGSLQKVGVEAYGAPGDIFDPNIHQAISNDPTDDAKKDHTISAVLQRGYKLHDKVIRPALVKVYQA